MPVNMERYEPREFSDFLERYIPELINGSFEGKHIVSVEQFRRNDLNQLFELAFDFREAVKNEEIIEVGKGKTMAALFYEPSTRTDMSFQSAMVTIGGDVNAASNGVDFSSVSKGETFADTVRAFGCYADVVVLRHPTVGSSYEAAYYLDRLNGTIINNPVLINGGDGPGEHPTQALLDAMTIVDFKGGFDGLNITMVGDLKYGRTVKSLSKLFALCEAQDTRIQLVSPKALRMTEDVLSFLSDHNIDFSETEDLEEVIGESDVIYLTRVQKERFDDQDEYERLKDSYIITPSVMERAKEEAILMHPLPRVSEMGSAAEQDLLDKDPRLVIFQQMENGRWVRMALMAKVLGVA